MTTLGDGFREFHVSSIHMLWQKRCTPSVHKYMLFWTLASKLCSLDNQFCNNMLAKMIKSQYCESTFMANILLKSSDLFDVDHLAGMRRFRVEILSNS